TPLTRGVNASSPQLFHGWLPVRAAAGSLHATKRQGPQAADAAATRSQPERPSPRQTTRSRASLPLVIRPVQPRPSSPSSLRRVSREWRAPRYAGLLVAAAALACSDDDAEGPAQLEPEPAVYCKFEDQAEVDARVDALLGQLTLEDKARMMRGDGLTAPHGIWRASGIESVDIPGIRSEERRVGKETVARRRRVG